MGVYIQLKTINIYASINIKNQNSIYSVWQIKICISIAKEAIAVAFTRHRFIGYREASPTRQMVAQIKSEGDAIDEYININVVFACTHAIANIKGLFHMQKRYLYLVLLAINTNEPQNKHAHKSQKYRCHCRHILINIHCHLVAFRVLVSNSFGANKSNL